MAERIRLKYLCSSFSTPITQDEVLGEGDYPVFGASGQVGFKNDYAFSQAYLGIVKDGAGVGRIAQYPANSSLLGTMAYIIPNKGVDIVWLKYAIMGLDLGKDISSTTIPHIYFKDYGNREVAITTLDAQCRIASVLDEKCTRVESVIERTRATIEEYKKLRLSVITQAVTSGIYTDREKKSTGVDWLRSIPTEWSMERGKGLFIEVDNRSEDGTEELLTVSQYTGVTPRSQKNVNMFEAESLEGYKICEVGDIAANTMWLWAGAIGVSQYRGVISPSYNIYRQTNNKYVPEYLDYLLRATPLVQHYESLSTGIRASRLRLYPQQFLSIRYPVPPIQEQMDIINYLHDKIDGMDRLIQKKERYLSEIEGYKKALIYEYVTGKKEV